MSDNQPLNSGSGLVSVVIPVYNVEKFIEEALDSVIAQTYSYLDIIVVDDQSPDNSIALVERYTDPRIRIIRQQNRGLAGARNTGIREARGQFVAFLDSDDFWEPTKIEKHIRIMDESPNIGVSFCSSLFIDEQSESLGRLQAPKKTQNYTAKDIFCRNPIGNGSVPVIRKSILEQIGFQSAENTADEASYTQYFDESLKQSEDVDCWTRIAIQTGTQFHYIDQPLTYYRLNNQSLSSDVEKQFSTWLNLLENLERYAPEFAAKYGPVAKTFQYRYLARRSIFQGEAKTALHFMWLALTTRPLALTQELKKTLETSIAGLVLVFFSRKVQLKIVQKFMRQRGET